MNILAIESSSKILSVALRKSENACFQLRSWEQFKCEHVIELIKQVLKQAKLAPCDLDYIAVGLGPGSFTGLRIGIASAKALSLALGIEIIGVGSLDIIGASINSSQDDICVIVDAKRSNLYAAIFKGGNSRKFLLRKKLKTSLLSYGQLSGKIKSKTFFAGDGILVFKEIISREKPQLAIFAAENLWYPEAGVLAEIAADLINRKRVGDKNRKILPIYLYPKDCQVRNEKHKK